MKIQLKLFTVLFLSAFLFVAPLKVSAQTTVTPTSTPSTTTNQVPVTGYDQVLGITLGSGIILLATYFYVWGDTSKQIRGKRHTIEE